MYKKVIVAALFCAININAMENNRGSQELGEQIKYIEDRRESNKNIARLSLFCGVGSVALSLGAYYYGHTNFGTINGMTFSSSVALLYLTHKEEKKLSLRQESLTRQLTGLRGQIRCLDDVSNVGD